MPRLATVLCLALGACARSAPPAPPAEEIVPYFLALAGADEPGERMVWEGRVLDASGAPVAGAVVRVHHADAAGLYQPPGAEASRPRLSGAVSTDAEGRFRFRTVRPGAYPEGGEPAHMHAVASASGHGEAFITFFFADDPLLTEEHRRRDRESTELAIATLRLAEGGGLLLAEDLRLPR